MRQKMALGEELETLSTREFVSGLTALFQQLNDAKTPDDLVIAPVVSVSAAGLIAGQNVYQCPTGFRAEVLRVVTWCPPYLPQTPLTAGNILLSRSAATAPPDLYFPGSGNVVIPATYESGTDSAPRIRNGEQLIASGSGLPANAQITLLMTIRLWSDVARGRFDVGSL